MSAPYAEKLVSSQLSVQLPQNSGARGKGNWPSEIGQFQYLASCPLSRRCDMISKRATKSKPNDRKEVARARNLEIYSNRGKGCAKAWEGRRAGSGPARAGTGLSLHSNLSKPGKLALPRAGQQRHYSLRAEAGGPCPKRLRRTATIVVPICGFARQRFHPRKNPSRGIVTAR
jgi:hypothetical protein